MYSDENDYQDRTGYDGEYGPLPPENPPHGDEFGDWVRDEYGWRYELNWLGIACAIEDERVMLEAMAEQHYAELAAQEGKVRPETDPHTGAV